MSTPMQRYNISRDGDLMQAQAGYFYVASDVDARIAELEKALTGFIEFQVSDYGRKSDAAKRYCELRRAAQKLLP